MVFWSLRLIKRTNCIFDIVIVPRSSAPCANPKDVIGAILFGYKNRILFLNKKKYLFWLSRNAKLSPNLASLLSYLSI